MSNYAFQRKPQHVPFVNTTHRTIQSPIPAPGTEIFLEELAACESKSMQGQLPIIWDRAEDVYIFDHLGNKWIDFTSTIFVANIGHANQHLISSVKSALDNSLVHTYAYPNKIRLEYLKLLVQFAGNNFEKGFLLSSGTEATEVVLKLMRVNGQASKKRRLGVICLEGNWHGRTMGAQLMSSNLEQKQWIGCQDLDIHHLPFPYPWEVEENNAEKFLHESLTSLKKNNIDLEKDICGVMLETFQGWGAVFYPNAYVKAIEKMCREYNILLAFDEMQAGFGRTGTKFGYEHYGVQPDLICCGKGMGGGFPLSGVLGKSWVMDLPGFGNMSSTHSANPISCAAGLATIQEIESKGLVRESFLKGQLLNRGLLAIQTANPDRISYVLGKGLLAAVLFRNPNTGEPDNIFPSRVSEICMQMGLLVVHTGREAIKIGPPLTITEDCLQEGIDVFKEAIQQAICQEK
jgi:4-aminobutyrate aminotransferase / (S)-3-amino-2-methylpropionate transaminase / 5-aminovalerate transaminase